MYIRQERKHKRVRKNKEKQLCFPLAPAFCFQCSRFWACFRTNAINPARVYVALALDLISISISTKKPPMVYSFKMQMAFSHQHPQGLVVHHMRLVVTGIQ